jgi:hypothetical protein
MYDICGRESKQQQTVVARFADSRNNCASRQRQQQQEVLPLPPCTLPTSRSWHQKYRLVLTQHELRSHHTWIWGVGPVVQSSYCTCLLRIEYIHDVHMSRSRARCDARGMRIVPTHCVTTASIGLLAAFAGNVTEDHERVQNIKTVFTMNDLHNGMKKGETSRFVNTFLGSHACESTGKVPTLPKIPEIFTVKMTCRRDVTC